MVDSGFLKEGTLEDLPLEVQKELTNKFKKAVDNELLKRLEKECRR